MTYRLVWPDLRVWKSVVDAVKELVTEVNLMITEEEGLGIQSMGSTGTTLMEVRIPPSSFSSFSCPGDVVVGISLTNMLRLLKVLGSENGELVMEGKKDGDEMVLSTARTRFALKLMDLEGGLMEIPEVEYRGVVTMPSDLFAKTIRGLGDVGDTITVTLKGDQKIHLHSKEDTMEAEVSLGGEEDEVVVEEKGGGTLSFQTGTRYFLAFTKALPLSPTVTLSMGGGVPLRVDFGETVRYYVAPMVPPDE